MAKKAKAIAFIASFSIAQGQQDSGEECDSNTKWMNNAKGESPCEVARNLIVKCISATEAISLPPLGGPNATSYANDWGNDCSCNTVVYNLISGCAVCQGFVQGNFSDWTKPCPSGSIQYMQYPDLAVAESFDTPQWAFVNTTKDGKFALREAKDLAKGGTDAHWTTIQILAPVIAAVGVVIIATGIFFWYRRRIKRRYVRIGDQSMLGTTRANASASVSTLRSWIGGSSSHRSTSTRQHKGKNVAWEAANLQKPSKFLGLIPSREKVHHRTRGADWSIDTDDVEMEDLDPLDPGSSTSNMNDNGSTPSFASSHRKNNNRSRGPENVSSSEGLRPIQDAPDVAVLNNVRPTQGVDRRGRPPPIHVVSTPPQRGFKLDDVDSTVLSTPVAPNTSSREASSSRLPERTHADGRGGRAGVLLISQTPGQDFNSTITSPIGTDRQDSTGQLPPAFSDDSSILRPSLSRDRPAFNSINPTIHASPPSTAALSSPPHLAQPRRLDPSLLFPASVRAAGYPHAVSLTIPEISHHRNISEPNLPSARDEGTSPARAHPSFLAPALQTRHSTIMSDVASSRSSDYNVPNPFRLDPRKPYSTTHVSPLSPVENAFKSNRSDTFDLDS